jgi:omega-6 fatty acid desaturase (delta-12 desaturase)
MHTIDRPYHPVINKLHHHIGSTHIIHHIFSALPHYNAVEATKCFKKFLKEQGKESYYLYSDEPIWKVIWKLAKN